MSSERPDDISEPQSSKHGQPSDNAGDSKPAVNQEQSDPPAQRPATVIVRGEMVADQPSNSQSSESSEKGAKESPGSDNKDSSAKNDDNSARRKVSDVKARMQERLPALDDDDEVAVQKEHVVVRDGTADLVFTGTLLASAAPAAAPKGSWEEYRVYETSAGKHVFSKITRRVGAEERDDHAAEIFDPAPSSMSSQLLKKAHDLTHERPKNWTDAAVDFFGYEPLAKALYRKLGSQFEEHVP